MSGALAGAAGLLACVLAATASLPAAAQVGRGVRLAGGLATVSGTSAGGGHALVGEAGTGIALGRSSSRAADGIGGFIGIAFSPRARFAVETAERRFASVAFPLHPTHDGVLSVLEELGEPDRASWRLGRWSPSESTYVEAGDGLETLERGRGYFLITAEPEEVEQVGLTAPVESFAIELEEAPGGGPAWNQLGNPFLFAVPVGGLAVTDGSVTVPLADPGNTLTEPVVRLYRPESDSYTADAAAIRAGEAFWVRKLAPGPVRLVVPFRAAPDAEEPEMKKPVGAAWAVAITARQGSRAGEPLMVGAAPVAGGWNPLCVARAPDPPGGGLSLGLAEPGFGRLAGDYVRVFRAPRAAGRWEIEARGVAWPGELLLEVRAFDLPPAARLSIVDADGTAHPVADGTRLTLAARRDQRLRLEVTEGASVPAPEGDGFRFAYPNPFRGPTGLAFRLAGPARVEVAIHDVSGRRLRTLAARAEAAGERVLVWDGRDERGRAVPPGVYLARHRAGSASGVTRLVRLP